MLGPVSDRLEHYLDLLSVRQKLTASNLANADTPNYRTLDVDFATELRNAKQTQPEVKEVDGLLVRNDGNNVSVDRETRLLAENALRFQFASALLRNEVRSLRNTIQEGRGA